MIIAIDGGSTKTISVLFDEKNNEIVSSGLAGSANYSTNPVERSMDNLKKSIGEALKNGNTSMDRIDRAIVSIVGIGDSEEATLIGRRILSEVLGSIKYEAVNDGLAAYHLGNGNMDGIAFAPGTGSVGYYRHGDEMNRFGGWGWSIGDMSSATWFSKKSIERAMFEIDSETIHKPFKNMLEKHFGMDIRELAWKIETRKMPKEVLASFSRRLSLMASDGDPYAISLYEESGKYMGEVVNGIERKIGAGKRVSIMGGTMQAGDFYHKIIRKYIPDANIFYGYEIVVGALMGDQQNFEFGFRDDLLRQLARSLESIPVKDLKEYLNIEKPLPRP